MCSSKLIEYIEENITNLDDANVYYHYPALRELDEKPLYPSVFIISPRHGVIIFKCDSITRDRELENLIELDLDLERMEELIFAKLLKSSNRKMKSGKRALSFNLTSALYVPNYSGKEVFADFNCKVIVNNQDVKTFFEDCEEAEISSEILQEIYALVDASKAIVKPKERAILESDRTSKAYILKQLEEEIAEFDDSQKYAALSQLEGPQRIRGLAGSGKTVILCIKAALLHLNNPNKRILYTFMTKSLYDYIQLLITRFYRILSDGKLPDFENCIHIRHAWGGQNVKGVYFDCCRKNSITPSTYNEASTMAGPKDAFDYVCLSLLEKTKGFLEKSYDYVLIDEAQDFKPSFYQICRAMVNNDCIVWSYDELQNIFDVKIQDTITTFKNKYGATGINLSELQKNHPDMENDIVLSKCYRNPKEILVTAHAIGFGIYNDTLIQMLENNSHWEDLGYSVSAGNCQPNEDMIIIRLEKNSPLSISKMQSADELIKLYSANDIDEEVSWVTNSIEEAIKKDGLRADDIIVISLDDRYSKSYFSKISQALYEKKIFSHNLSDNFYEKGFSEDECVTLSTIYKAKGNEAAMVFVVGSDVFEHNKDDRKMRNKAFTAFTRAKAWLRISGINIKWHSLWYEINQVKEKQFKLEFPYKEAHVIQRDLDVINSQAAKKREIIQEMLSKAKKSGIHISDKEIIQAFQGDKFSGDGSEAE